MREGNILLFEDFTRGMEDWWVEGGQKVWVQGKRLHMKADPEEMTAPDGVCTAWHREIFPANIRIDFQACCQTSAIDANNINFFLAYSDPSGKPLQETREQRADGGYAHYHQLDGNIVTFLNDFHQEAEPYPDGTRPARIRIRHCPGFELLSETFTYRCRKREVYQCSVVKFKERIEFRVDGETRLTAIDPAPRGSGHIGLRTFRTYLWWDTIRVTELV